MVEIHKEPEVTQMIFGENDSLRKIHDLVRKSQAEILMGGIPLEKGLLDALEHQALRSKVRLLTSKPSEREENRHRHAIQWHVIVKPLKLGVLVSDEKEAMILQYSNGSESIESAIYLTNKQTIQGVVSIFEALWSESEQRDRESSSKRREEVARRRSQLLQDILAHDIRNYNQVARLSAELIADELSKKEKIRPLIDNLLDSIDGSTQLVERARKLDAILSEENPGLFTVDLEGAIRRSLSLVRNTYPQKRLETEISRDPDETQKSTVFADDLLDEVFVNLFTNSVKYTPGKDVKLEIRIDKHAHPREGWRITVSDHGRGIPDSMKEQLFERYLSGRGNASGLGMSIVYGLVVERYGGDIRVRNRVPDDHAQGASFELTLPSPS